MGKREILSAPKTKKGNFSRQAFRYINPQKILTPLPFIQKLEKSLLEVLPLSLRSKLGEEIWLFFISVKKTLLEARLKRVDRGEWERPGISYLELGRKEGPCLVLFHGFGDIKENFLFLAFFLRHQYRLIIPDLPGFGESEKCGDLEYSLKNFSLWMEEFLLGLGLSQIHLVGHSLGGAIAAYLCSSQGSSLDPLKFPLIKTLTLLNPAGVLHPAAMEQYKALFTEENPFLFKTRKELLSLMDKTFGIRPYIPLVILDFVAQTFRDETIWYSKIIRDLTRERPYSLEEVEGEGSIHDFILNQRIKRIKVPTLIVGGDKDQLIPQEVVRFFHQQIENSTLEIFQGIGHAPQMECPLKLAEKLGEFLANHNGQGQKG